MIGLRCAIATGLLLVSVAAKPRAQDGPVIAAGAPVTVARAAPYDMTSRLNGQQYRVFVSMPYGADPAKKYPVVYVLEGNIYFALASEILTRQSLQTIPATMAQAIVVGIGYPTDDPDVVNQRRGFDLTATDSDGNRARGQEGGGGEAYLSMIEDQVKPLVANHYPVDSSRQILYGHSVGGALALRSLFKNPTAFSTYVLSSPSIFIDNREVLKWEQAFSERAKAGQLHLQILVTSAGDEQYRGTDPTLLKAAQTNRSTMRQSWLNGWLRSVREISA